MNVLMPQLGETVAEGTVAVWHKKVGDKVSPDDVLFDVETDKASMEVPAQASGVVKEILVQAGATVNVGTVVAVIDTGDGAAAQPSAAGAPVAAAPAAAAATSAGAQAEAAPAAPAAAAAPAAPSPGASAAHGSNAAADTKPAQRSGQRRLSPAVRRIAAEHRLDLDAVSGTGRNGRITRRNVLEFIASGKAQHGGAAVAARPAPAQPAAAAAPAARAPSPGAVPAASGGNVVPFTRIRRLTAEHMVRSRATSPHVLQAVEVDFHRIDQVRRAVREVWKSKHGHSLTYLPFIGAAVCQALHDFPHLNASVEGDSLRLHEHVNLAIAVDLGPDGLVAPVIKRAETLSVAQLASAINDVSQRARSGRLKPDDLSGGTYTLSNSGTFGTLITAPIINQPQVAILSTDGVRKKPVVIESSEGDAIGIRPVGVLAQSFDHRAVDGAYSAAFLDKVRKLLENSHWVVEV